MDKREYEWNENQKIPIEQFKRYREIYKTKPFVSIHYKGNSRWKKIIEELFKK